MYRIRIGKIKIFRKILTPMVVGTVLLIFGMTPEAASKTPTVEERFPGLALNVLKSAALMPMKNGMLLTVDGIEIQELHLKKIVDDADPKLRGQIEKNLFFILEQEVTTKLLLKEANSAGIASDDRGDNQIIGAYLNRQTEGVSATDAEVRTFYDQNIGTW